MGFYQKCPCIVANYQKYPWSNLKLPKMPLIKILNMTTKVMSQCSKNKPPNTPNIPPTLLLDGKKLLP